MTAPSHASYIRNRKYYIDRETSEAGKAKRVARDQARTKMIKAGKISPHSKMTVDHKVPISKGGGNARSNLAIMSGTANRRKFD